jgi:hypothetical protein
MQETCQFADAQNVGITKPARALLVLGCPYSGTAAGIPIMPKAGSVCESVSGAADIATIGPIFSNFNDLAIFPNPH